MLRTPVKSGELWEYYASMHSHANKTVFPVGEGMRTAFPSLVQFHSMLILEIYHAQHAFEIVGVDRTFQLWQMREAANEAVYQ